MSQNQPDISLEQAIQKTKEAGFTMNYSPGQTIAEDIFQVKQDVKKTNDSIAVIKLFVGVVLIALIIAVILILSDYAQFATKAFEQFTQQMQKLETDRQTIDTIKTDVAGIKQKLNPTLIKK